MDNVKTCIWCRKTEKETSFNTKAHTIPKSLGGKNICDNVCDKCNSFFGSYQDKLPPIETVLKEALNISRARLLKSYGQVGKNKSLAKFSSIYFNVNLDEGKFSLKNSYKYQVGFQQRIARQFRRGLYKIYLEEIERQFGTAHKRRYDFIREFARFNIGDLPVFYFERNLGIIAIHKSWVESPSLLLEDDLQMKYLINEPGFTEFELIGQVFGITTYRNWEISFLNYKRKTKKAKMGYFKEMRTVVNFNDVDLTLNIFDS